jgi:hypothetical protein
LSRFIQKSLQSFYLFGSWIVWAQTAIFSAKPCSKKNAGVSTIVLWITARRMFEEYQQSVIQTTTVPRKVQITAWIQYSVIQTKIEDGPHIIEKYDKIRETDKITACKFSNNVPTKQEVGFIVV